jgi:hypothetical protein
MVKLCVQSKHNPLGEISRQQSRGLSFKLCQNFATLFDSITALQSRISAFRDLAGMYFYLVLDNVKQLLMIEKQKKVLEKLAIT